MMLVASSSVNSTLLTIAVIAERTGRDETIGIVKIDLESLTRDTSYDIASTLISRDGSPVTEGAPPSFHCRLMIKDTTPSSVAAPLPPAMVPTTDPSIQHRMLQYEKNSTTAQDAMYDVGGNSVCLGHRDSGDSSGSLSPQGVHGLDDVSSASASKLTDDPDRQDDVPAEDDTMKDLIDSTKSEMEQLGAEPPFLKHIAGIGEAVDGVTNVAGNAASIWGSVVDKVRVFMDVADTITEIHPYAKAAWSVISVVPKLINAQLQNDESMNRLGKAMDDMFTFYCETKALHDVRSHKATIERIVQQTRESALLIREYAETPAFWLRTMKYALSDIKTQFEEHAAAFESLRAIFVQYATIYAEENTRVIEAATARIDITTVRTLALVESTKEMLEDSDLRDIRCNFDAQCVPEKRCLPGTRVKILGEIMDWAYRYPAIDTNDPDHDPKDHASILLLTGVAGCGKSAIAHEVARRFADVRRLGASFCFDGSQQAARPPAALFGTIARGIAEVDKGWRTALLAVLGRLTSAERQTSSMVLQLENFIEKPSRQLHFVGPIVVVIDALDESGDADARELLLRNIMEMATILPPAFRILITTRPEKDIMDTLGKAASVQQMDVTSVDPDSVISDIHSFIRKELAGTGDLFSGEVGDANSHWSMQLAERSEGSFQWAATACKFIKGSGKAGQTPDERMEIILVQEGRRVEPLDDIYVRVLDSVCDFEMDGSPVRRRFQMALGLVLDIQEPLPLGALKELLRGNPEAVKALHAFILHLGSLFEGAADDSSRPLRPFHTSVRDFFRTEQRSKKYYVSPDGGHETLAQASLQTIARGPQFNICHVESSYIANSDILDLKDKIDTHISPALSYAHRLWDGHVCKCESTDAIQRAVDRFLDKSVLVWFEVMSLLGMVNTIGTRVRRLRYWNKQQKGAISDSTLTDLERFVSMCGSAISKSMPHLYLSALAFVPPASFIHKQHTKRFSRALCVANSGDIRWPQCLLRITAGKPVRGIAVSPDDRLIASSRGNHVQLWDATTGERVGEPLAGHSDVVRAIAFSPNGKTLVSASWDGTLILWNTTTSQPIGQPLHDDASGVHSVSFSQDGTQIVSGSYNSTIRIWDTATHHLVHTFEGHTGAVLSVAFSPDGRMVVSGSEDQTIRLWDLAAREQIGVAFTGHNGDVNSVGFSPDGKTIVSGSDDRTIRLWDVATHSPIGEPLSHHSHDVNSVAFSDDGSRLISSSFDTSIRVWDITQRRQVGLVLTGHTGWVESAVFPSDGLKVVSGSADGTIGVWDVTTDEPMNEAAATLSSDVLSVAFSPDGQRLAAGLEDGSIRLWDPMTGQAIGEPLVGHSSVVYSVVFSADGRKLISGSHDRTVRQWDTATGNMIGCSLSGHSKGVRSVAISQNGRWIVSGSLDGMVLRWNAVTGDQDGAFEIPGRAEVHSVAFSPDGRTVVAGLSDGTLRLWDTASTELIGGPLTGHTDQVWSVAFSPDGSKLASGSRDDTVMLWDMETKEAIGGPLTGHTLGVWTVAFSPDGKRIVSGSQDRTVRQWSVATQEPIGCPLAHTDTVFSAAISPDGQQIIVGTDDGSIKAWKMSAGTYDYSHDIGASSGARLLPYTDSSPIEDGWVLGPNGELLFWIAHDYRSALHKPGNEWVIAARSLKLHLSHFAHGTSWTDCRSFTAEGSCSTTSYFQGITSSLS
ncbi:WD40 repeat-like protein [Trametopsis cervina]|nr:WD40 repeat-like protein [Trametopsis cervina]